jgi:nifR3 family TIM-barrel protein
MKPFAVGGVEVAPPVLLAPMEDVTTAAFRLLAKRIAGPGLMFTEFVSAMALHHGARKTLKKMKVFAEERPLGIQIFGGEAETMAAAARLAEEMGADLVDINMGCWVPKVCKTGSGAALLRDPVLAEKIVDSVVRAVSVPVTVKVRAGWHYDLFAAPDLARRFQDVGAQMLTLHARFAKQGFEGDADWRLISALREAVTIPLIGNGDVRCSADAIRMFRETGCDGVMVGRAAIGNPWQLREIVRGVLGRQQLQPPTLSERISTALEHVRLALQIDGGDELAVVRSLRGVLPLYIKGEPGAAEVRQQLMKAETEARITEILREFESDVKVLAGTRTR